MKSASTGAGASDNPPRGRSGAFPEEAAMARTHYAPDRGLIARMGATMFLIGIVFTAFVIAVVFLLGHYGVSNGAVVCVTQGLLDRLNNSELEGVLAHEMSHVAHKDVAVMTIASFIGIVAALMVRFAFYSEIFGGGGGRGRGGRSGNDQNTALIGLGVMVIGIVVYAISFLLIRLLSRYRELSADRSGALLTGQPHALASALVKVSDDIARIPTRDLRAAEPLNAFFFAPAVALQRGGMSLSTLFSTHPPLEKRLKALDQIAKQLSR